VIPQRRPSPPSVRWPSPWPSAWKAPGLAALVAVALATQAPPAHALRVVTWNLLQYPAVSLSTRQPNFRTVMAAINADVVITQELDSAAGRDSFLTNVLNVVQPGEWTATSWIALGTEGGAVFYKPAKVTVSGLSTIATGGPRPVLQVLLKPVGYTSNAAATRLYSIHLKAGGPGTVDSTTRRNECNSLRNALNTVPAGTNMLLGGDSNFYGAYEGGYLRLTESQVDNDGRLFDPLAPYGVVGNWHTNSAYAVFDTQCPCNTGCLGGFSGGGMDDRFDIWLTSNSMKDGEGLDYVEDLTPTNGASPYVFGNDGTKFNNDINSGGSNGVVPIAVANALHDASDHLPVVITIQVPAKVLAPASIDFGNVIVGGVASQNLPVSNGAIAPADELTYTLTAPTGFTAPGGTFNVDAGAPANNHAIGMSTAGVGARAGTLTVSSDDVDVPVANVPLSGTVLDHAAASLDSASILVGSSVDLGDNQVGQFSNQPVRAHNFGYDALQARLSVNSANIVGGDGRFSIVGGFSPSLLAGTGQTYSIHFNDVGATLDQVYTATLTIASADEALPGAAAASDLVISLRAKPLSGAADVPGGPIPTTLAFYPPHPNPVARDVAFAFDLPQEAPVSLAIFDLSGRRVASITSGTLPAGHYQMPWNAVADGGTRVAGGLYFARFSTPGMNRVSRLIVLP
jgi:endonuclease/exonuclease/phosphatase family metal-dependent hydrolase